MSFLIKDDDLLKKYNDIWNKVINSIKKKLDCEPIYNIFQKTKTRSYGDEVRDFHALKTPKSDFNFIRCLIILINSIFKKEEKYYLFLKRILIH